MQTERFQQTAQQQPLVNGYPFREAVIGAAFRCVLGSSKDLRRSDSCFDPWIKLPASAIKRTVFLFSSSILCRNNEDSSSILRRNSKDSSSCCDLAMPCVLLSSKGWASDAELSDCTKDRRPERGTAEGCVKGLLQCNTPIQTRLRVSHLNRNAVLSLV